MTDLFIAEIHLAEIHSAEVRSVEMRSAGIRSEAGPQPPLTARGASEAEALSFPEAGDRGDVIAGVVAPRAWAPGAIRARPDAVRRPPAGAPG